ncbi:ABC transporter substrate-binding protein [Methanococcus voltae]|uniref:Iron complex transport system substrate-binding protein n=2 Tax=Methanococcus voltae TaxID=2188 RepID=A0A8J7S5E6_METVO|nr:ABC transporter substrate-binding protein [Methanococcus voltae]MBP2172882.1 iron complex transport system substrate-binding protein [Methanococcus voltae]MBP2201708.1 iron complex transport system substrate-binding protein [Methanococcus voltae]MCS3922496.1 iron complex transport system substrate-binding protein [Methanococcus voltae PS]
MKLNKNMKKNLKTIILTMFLSVILAMSGCVSTQTDTPDNTTVKDNEITKISTISLTDGLNNNVTVNYPCRSVVSTYGMIPPIIYSLDAQDTLKAGKGIMGSDEFLRILNPNFDDMAQVNTENVEEIKKTNPDIVFAPYWNKKNGIYTQLNSLDVPVFFVDIETVPNYYKLLSSMGKMFNKSEKSDYLIDYYKGKIQYIQDTVKDSEKPKVLVLAHSAKKNSFWTPGGDFWGNEMVDIAGGVSVSKDLETGKMPVNVEQISNWNPDKIIIITYTRDFSSIDAKNQLMNDEGWKEINAVKNGEVYGMPNDGDSWDVLSPKFTLGLMWAAKVIHPEVMNVSLKDEAMQQYVDVYNMTPEQISKVNIVGDAVN